MDLNFLPLGILLVSFFILFGLERFFPLRKPTFDVTRRFVINLMITGLTFLTVLIWIKPFVRMMMGLPFAQKIGLLQFISLPPWVVWVLGFLLLDLSFYYWHHLNHRISILWRFHNVHHCDPDLDTTTAFRFHFVEISFSAIFRVIQITLIGPPVLLLFVYEILFNANTIFHHSNCRLPIKLERILNLVLVTPRMHGIHHSQNKEEANSNYAVIFSFWDRLHQTLRLNVPQKSVFIGVPGYSRYEDQRFLFLLLMPFRKQRPYWSAGKERESDGEKEVFVRGLLAE